MTSALIPGFHPDPSICRVDQTYYLATSSFEYLPGVPIFSSPDLESWTLLGHVATRPGQLGVADVATNGGAWAPTLRHHEGRFHVVLTDAIGGRGTVLFTAEDAAGPWDDGRELTLADGAAITGIDPDLAWDADGTCYLTYAGLHTAADTTVEGILQARFDLASGQATEPPRVVWQGRPGVSPEAPHLYQIEGTWYLLTTEGSGPGQAITIARGPAPVGPFAAAPSGPTLTARGTEHALQNLGHADLVHTEADGWAMALHAARPMGLSAAFAPLGRETLIAPVTWQDGWPVVAQPSLGTALIANLTVAAELGEGSGSIEDFDAELGPDWIGVRRLPSEITSVTERPGWLRLTGEGANMSALHPIFVGQRQTAPAASFTALFDFSAGAGGLVLRIDDDNYVQIRVDQLSIQTNVRLNTIEYDHAITRPTGVDQMGLRISADPEQRERGPEKFGSDVLRMAIALADPLDESNWFEMAVVDGRYLTPEVCESLAGRVVGVFAEYGTVDVDWFTVESLDG